MDSEKQIITNPKLEEKVKNPKRVAQGKKLSEINRVAKARKQEQHNDNESESDFSQLPSLTTSISLVGVVTGVIGTYIAWKNFKQEEVNTSEAKTKSTPSSSPNKPTPKPTEAKYNNLDDDDI